MSAAVDEQIGTAATSILTERAEAAREDFHEFAAFCMRDEHGDGIVQESLHRVIQLHIDVCWAAGRHAAILAPFSHGKTIQTAVGRVCWELGRDQTLRWKIV